MSEEKKRTMMKITPKINRAYYLHKIDNPDAKKEEFLCSLAEMGADQMEMDFQERQAAKAEPRATEMESKEAKKKK